MATKQLGFKNLPAVTVLPTPSAELEGVLVKLASDKKPYYCNGSSWVDLSATGSGSGASSLSSLTKDVHLVGHGFTVGTCVRSYNSTYYRAQYSTQVSGIVSAVADADNFTYTLAGEVTGLSGLFAGANYFVNTDGDLVLNSDNDIDYQITLGGTEPVLCALTETSGLFLAPTHVPMYPVDQGTKDLVTLTPQPTVQTPLYYDTNSDTYLPASASSMQTIATTLAVGVLRSGYSMVAPLSALPKGFLFLPTGDFFTTPELTAADGALVYLSETPGEVTLTPPAIRQVLGRVYNNTVVWYSPYIEPTASAGGAQQVFVQSTAPAASPGVPYLWFQTGMGPEGDGFTLWIGDEL